MKNRLLTAIGLLIIDMGIFAIVCTFLPRPRGFGHSGAWSYFVNSRYRWDFAWGSFIAALLVSIGIFLLLEAFGKFKDE